MKSKYNFTNLFAETPSVNLSLISLGYTFNMNKSYLTANINGVLFSEEQYSQSSVDINYAYSVYSNEKNEIKFDILPVIGFGYTSDYVRGKGLNSTFVELRNNLFTVQYGLSSMFFNKKGLFAGINIYHMMSNASNWINASNNAKMDNIYNLNQLVFDFRLGFRLK